MRREKRGERGDIGGERETARREEETEMRDRKDGAGIMRDSRER